MKSASLRSCRHRKASKETYSAPITSHSAWCIWALRERAWSRSASAQIRPTCSLFDPHEISPHGPLPDDHFFQNASCPGIIRVPTFIKSTKRSSQETRSPLLKNFNRHPSRLESPSVPLLRTENRPDPSRFEPVLHQPQKNDPEYRSSARHLRKAKSQQTKGER
jgi:hypothetical protein